MHNPSLLDTIDFDFISSLNEKRRKRLISALDGEMFTYPMTVGVYRVFSVKGDSTNIYTVSYKGTDLPSCTCHDFFFECQFEDGSVKHRCKHGWRVWCEIQNINLPPPDIDPENWIKNKIKDDLQKIDKNKQSYNYNSLSRLLIYVNQSEILDFEKIYDKWRDYRKY